MSLRDIQISISYKSKGKDNIADALIVPALKQTKIYKRSVGFFSSSVFELTRAGLNSLIEQGGEYRIICSPELSDADIEAIQTGYEIKEKLLQNRVIEDIQLSLESISDENLAFLVKMISINILNIKIVDVDDKYGIYHDKIGLFIDEDNNKVLFVGSPNESKAAYTSNYEKIRVTRSWEPGGIERIQDDEEEFDSIWDDNNEYLRSIDISRLVGKEIKEELQRRRNNSSSDKGVSLRKYQENAIKAWSNNDNQGFFVMATGTGKTWTAIYAAKTITDKEDILLVICAPYKHLIRQWYEDVRKVYPDNVIVLVSGENHNWQEELTNGILNSKYNGGGTVIAISTIVSFNRKEFGRIAEKFNKRRMLIVDEAHRFRNRDEKLHILYQYWLGLSATPTTKSYDDDQANELMNYFGGKVYNLPIEYAISHRYLVHYCYWPIFVNATEEEERDFQLNSAKMAGCFRNGVLIKTVEELAKYRRARLRVISMAEEKQTKFNSIISQIKEKDHFIVYCGDGKLFDEAGEEKRHIQHVKEELSSMGFKVNQFTASEDMKERMQRIETFNNGMVDGLVAIRCLDEGVNIPSIKGALLLSSNDDYREFVQRRGRILRTYTDPRTNEEKEVANIYDVIVLPDYDLQTFAKIELRRFYEYARLADNKDKCMELLQEYMTQYDLELSDLTDVEESIEDDLDE